MQVVEGQRLSERVHSRAVLVLLTVTAAIALVIYAGLIPSLYLRPQLGIRLLWFLFIPIAPMLFLAAPNVWVSVCPLATIQTALRRVGWKQGKRLSAKATARLQIAGWVILFAGIPTRHLIFNANGTAVFVAATAITLVALGAGLIFLTLSGWCTGVCPIRPVEVLYGQLAIERNRPAQCSECDGCVPVCTRTRPEGGAAELLRGGAPKALAWAFPGFVLSYFLLDIFGYCSSETRFFDGTQGPGGGVLAQVFAVYGGMALGGLASWAIMLALSWIGLDQRGVLKLSAVAAYSFYYWGAVPGIVRAWSLGAEWRWVLWAIPLAVLLGAIVTPRFLSARGAARPE